MLGLRLNDGEPPTQCVSVPAKTTSCFMLPVLNKQYLMKHTFTEWKELWDFQVTENEPLHLTGPQLKNVLMAHLDTPWRDEILQLAMGKPLKDVMEAVEKRCAVYKPTSSSLILVKKKPTESFDLYLQRLTKFAEKGGLSYTKEALCDILYQYVPPHIRSMVKTQYEAHDPALLAATADNEMDRDRGLPALSPHGLRAMIFLWNKAMKKIKDNEKRIPVSIQHPPEKNSIGVTMRVPSVLNHPATALSTEEAAVIYMSYKEHDNYSRYWRKTQH